MELEEEQEDLIELCAEILENWTSPIYSNSAHQNPFSMQNQEEVDICSIISNGSLSCNNMETGLSTLSKSKHDDFTQMGIELEQKEDKTMTALPAKGSKCEHTENVGNNPQIMPMLIEDTFYDRLLGHSVDGIDMASMYKVKEATKKRDEDENDFRIILTDIRNNGKEAMEKKLSSAQISSSGFKCNIPMDDTLMPKGSLTSKRSSFVDKLRFQLPSNKTIFDINIDDFGEKSWRKPGVDVSDFFNFGFDEQHWKDYCKLMQAQVLVRSSGQSKITADRSRQPHKECPLLKDRTSNDSDVIIEIVMHDSMYENGLREEHIDHRMINGDKILPFPMDIHLKRCTENRKQRKEQRNLSSAQVIIPINSLNSEIEMEVEDLVNINFEEELKRKKRRERFKDPLPSLKNVVADKRKVKQIPFMNRV